MGTRKRHGEVCWSLLYSNEITAAVDSLLDGLVSNGQEVYEV